MRLKGRELESQLQRAALPVYALFSDAPFLLQEAEGVLLASWSRAGFPTRQRLFQDSDLWSQLRAERDALSLFSEPRVLILRLEQLKIGKEGADALRYWLAAPPADTQLLLSGPRPDASGQKTAWFQALDQSPQAGVALFYPPGSQEWPRWVAQRLRAAGLPHDEVTIGLLAQRSAGNLAACHQAIQRWAEIYPGQALSPAEIMELLGDSSQFSSFDLADSVLRGDAAAVLHQLQRLRSGTAEPILILWALHRDLTLLLRLQGGDSGSILRQERAFPPRSDWLQRAARRLQPEQLWEALARCVAIDARIKGQDPTPIWPALAELTLALCQSPETRARHVSSG